MFVHFQAQVLYVTGLVNLEDTKPSLFIYPPGESSADYMAPQGYVPQFAAFDKLTDDEKLEINTHCMGNKVI